MTRMWINAATAAVLTLLMMLSMTLLALVLYMSDGTGFARWLADVCTVQTLLLSLGLFTCLLPVVNMSDRLYATITQHSRNDCQQSNRRTVRLDRPPGR